MNTNGDLFCEFSDMKMLFVIGTKLNKTAWKILKPNKCKQNIKSPKRKLKEKLKSR